MIKTRLCRDFGTTFMQNYCWEDRHHTTIRCPNNFLFIHPHVKSRLERLMESNVVSLTDRTYMITLTKRIIEDYIEAMEKRIQTREDKEVERIKNLVLTERIPKSQAPLSMARHPVMLIERYCNKLINERRKKMKIPKAVIPTHLYYDDTPDPPSGLSIEKGHHYRMHSERLCNPITQFVEIPDQDDETKKESPETKQVAKKKVEVKEPVTQPQTEEPVDLMKFEEELIQILKGCQTVEEIYKVADELIGELKHLTEDDAISVLTTMSDIRPSIMSEIPLEGMEGAPRASVDEQARASQDEQARASQDQQPRASQDQQSVVE